MSQTKKILFVSSAAVLFEDGSYSIAPQHCTPRPVDPKNRLQILRAQDARKKLNRPEIPIPAPVWPTDRPVVTQAQFEAATASLRWDEQREKPTIIRWEAYGYPDFEGNYPHRPVVQGRSVQPGWAVDAPVGWYADETELEISVYIQDIQDGSALQQMVLWLTAQETGGLMPPALGKKYNLPARLISFLGEKEREWEAAWELARKEREKEELRKLAAEFGVPCPE